MSSRCSLQSSGAGRRQQSGFTLIELMISLLLGLLVVAAAGAIFLSNRQTYVATESLGRVQESARVAFEIMARDLREAGGNPCDRRASVANVINSPATTWWTSWHDGVVGFDGSAAMTGLTTGAAVGERVAGTDAIELKSAHVGASVVSHDAAGASFVVDNNPANGLVVGDLALVCDYTQASVFQVSAAAVGPNTTVGHAAAAGTPGNCTQGLGLPIAACGPGSGTVYIYPKNSTIAKVSATRWYVGNNDTGGMSLFRQTRRSAASGVEPEEVVPHVTGMTLEYLVPGSTDYVPATGVAGTQWGEVSSVRITVALQGEERVGSSGERITRSLAYVASLRNRNI